MKETRLHHPGIFTKRNIYLNPMSIAQKTFRFFILKKTGDMVSSINNILLTITKIYTKKKE